MKKRLRKKLHLGEFQELGFYLKATYAEIDEGQLEAFANPLLDKIDELEMVCGGHFDSTDMELFVTTGLVGTGEAEKRQAVLDFTKAMPGVTTAEASEFSDAWYDSKGK